MNMMILVRLLSKAAVGWTSSGTHYKTSRHPLTENRAQSSPSSCRTNYLSTVPWCSAWRSPRVQPKKIASAMQLYSTAGRPTKRVCSRGSSRIRMVHLSIVLLLVLTKRDAHGTRNETLSPQQIFQVEWSSIRTQASNLT